MSNKKRLPGRPAKYPPEFQRDAVAMVLDERRSIADVARSIGVIEGTLGNWVSKARRKLDHCQRHQLRPSVGRVATCPLSGQWVTLLVA